MLFSLRSRLMLTFLILLLIPFIVLALVIPYHFSDMMEDQIETSTVQTMDQYTLYINSITTQAEEIAKQVLVNQRTQQLLNSQKRQNTTVEERLIMNNQLREFLNSISVNNSNGIGISVFFNDGTSTWVNDKQFLKSDWYRHFSEGNQRWMSTHADLYEPLAGRRVNSYLLPLFDINTLKKQGVIKVNFPTTLLENALNSIQLGKSGRIYLMDWNGQNVLQQEVLTKKSVINSSIDQMKLDSKAKGVLNISDDGEKHLVFYQKLKVNDWILIGEVPEAELYSKIDKLQQSLLLTSAILFVLTILASMWLSSNIAHPLAKLAKAMTFVEKGEFMEAKRFMPSIKSNNSEVGYVIKVFSHMIERLKHLIETEYESNIRRKNAEYKALLLQINPHFMNNTLEIIGGLAAQGRNNEVMDVSVSLGRMMRYSLESNSHLVRLSEEMSYIRHYSEIVKLRYEEYITIDIVEDPLTKDMRIIKFILQPLVENAVKYSIEGKKYAEIKIVTEKIDDVLAVTVEDNGIGMSHQVIANLMEEGQRNQIDSNEILASSGRRIGFRNVIGRLKLYYNERFWYQIDSQPGVGTKITLWIELVKGEL
jgi:two-component system, sensor histidine kinase YesM